jgi:poly(3-hydroxybutyrate) depolymerase
MASVMANVPSVWVAACVCAGCAAEAPLSELSATSSATGSTVTTTASTTSANAAAATTPTTSVTPQPVTVPGEAASNPSATEASIPASAEESRGASEDATYAPIDPSAAIDPSDSSAPIDSSAGDSAIAALETYLELPHATRPPVSEQGFRSVPLTGPQSDSARELLWEDHVELIGETRAAEHAQKSIAMGDFRLRYDYTTFGDAPADGRSLYISLHGGGEAEASVNDDQWENQKLLYQPDEGIYLSPRAPTDTWNMWHQDHIDPLFERLIENFVALEGVNPNRVYVMGYSAGGDGVYQLGPRMADHWAAASAMAGHPNEAKPFSLRNIGFTIHVGGDDTAFDRNLVAVEWRDQLDALQAGDPMGYEHEVEVHAGKPHWMDLEDAVAVPWMAAFTRNPTPSRIVWYQDDILHDRFYWLRNLQPLKETTLEASVIGQEVNIDTAEVNELAVMLSDAMLDLDQPVKVVLNGKTVHEAAVQRTIGSLYATLAERGDPASMFPAQVVISR